MRPKSLVLLFLALGCGLAASIGISQVIDKQRQSGPSTVDTEAIYVAKMDINLGDPVKPEMISLEAWPKDKIPVGAIRELSEIEERRPRAKIFAGEPILDGKLLNPGENADPTLTIPKGFRVLPISVKADTGMAGLIKPGDRVDVQWFVPRSSSQDIDKTTTKIILHNIRVFAVDQTVRRLADGEEVATLAKTVSLLVTPKQANMLRLADKVGEISLVARHPDDVSDSADAAEASFESLLTGREKSSREEERRDSGSDQNRKESGGILGALLNGLKANASVRAAAIVKPPFRMQVISGDQVEVQLFHPLDGRRIEHDEAGFGGAGFGPPAAPDGYSFGVGATDHPPVAPTGGNENDFPIDLEEE